MLAATDIEQDTRFSSTIPTIDPVLGQMITYRKKDTDQLVFRKRFQLSNFFRQPNQLSIVNKILERSPTNMPAPSSIYTFPKQSDAVLASSPDPSLYFNGSSLNLDGMRRWLLNRRETLTQNDLDILIAFFYDLLVQSDDSLNVHPNLKMQDVYFDNGRLKVLSPLISDAHFTEFTEAEVNSILAAGQSWQPVLYTDSAARRQAATSNSNVKKVVSCHEDWFSRMVQHCYIVALSLACCADDRSFYSNGVPNAQNVRDGLEVVFFQAALENKM